jgi:hypothetical protein
MPGPAFGPRDQAAGTFHSHSSSSRSRRNSYFSTPFSRQ